MGTAVLEALLESDQVSSLSENESRLDFVRSLFSVCLGTFSGFFWETTLKSAPDFASWLLSFDLCASCTNDTSLEGCKRTSITERVGSFSKISDADRL